MFRFFVVDVEGLRGRTFVNDPDEEGNQVRAKIIAVEPTDQLTADKKH
jgi:hypothetical protein